MVHNCVEWLVIVIRKIMEDFDSNHIFESDE